MERTEHVDNRTFPLTRNSISHDPIFGAAADAVRAAVLDGLSTIEAFAAATGKCKRTVNLWIAQGMPIVRIGRTPYIPIMEGRAWLLKPASRNTAPRKVGRPTKKAAA